MIDGKLEIARRGRLLKIPEPGGLTGSLEADGCTVRIFGKLFGVVAKETVRDRDAAVEWIHQKAADGSLLRDLHHIVGPCVIVVERPGSVEVVLTYSSPSLFYIVEDDKVVLFGNEKDPWTHERPPKVEIDDWALVNAVASHQVLSRAPFRTMFRGLNRLPSTCSLLVRDDRLVTRTALGYVLVSDEARPMELERPLRETLRLLAQDQQKAVLRYSGGIDSSLLLAGLAHESPGSALAYHIPMKGPGNLAFRTGLEITDELDVPLDLARRKGFSVEDVEKVAAHGPFSFVGGLGRMFDLGGNGQQIEGQNADMLYQVDVNATGDGHVGVKSLFHTWRAVPERVHWTVPYMGGNLLARGLRGEPFVRSLDRGSLLGVQTHGLVEHSLPGWRTGSVDAGLGQGFSRWRRMAFVDDVLRVVEDTVSGMDALSPLQELRLQKIVRWFRSVPNVYDNRHGGFRETGVAVLQPFSEGPVAWQLLRYGPGLGDAFFPKRGIHRLFAQLAGAPYDRFKRRARSRRFQGDYPLRSELDEEMAGVLETFWQKRSAAGDVRRMFLARLVQQENVARILEGYYRDSQGLVTSGSKKEAMLAARLWNLDLFLQKTLPGIPALPKVD